MDSKQALGLPAGSIRAILSLMLIGTVCALTFLGVLDPTILGGLAGAAIGFYFGQKSPPTP